MHWVELTVRITSLGFAASVLALAVPGCSKENTVNTGQSCKGPLVNEGAACDASLGCPCGGEGACVGGFCREACKNDADCGGGAICLKDSSGLGGCLLPRETTCGPSNPCLSPLLACGGDGKCRLFCSQDAPCPNNDQECIANACYGENEPNHVWTCNGKKTGDFQCDDGELQVCNTAGLGWATVQTCASQTLCQSGMKNGRCAPPACAAGAYSCDGAKLRRCNADSTDWIQVEECGSAPDCAQAVVLGSCPQICTPDSVFCEGQSLMVCDSTGKKKTKKQECTSVQLCLEAAGQGVDTCPTFCPAGEIHCDGNKLQRCSNTGGDWQTEDTCVTADLCLQAAAQGATTCPDYCTAGALRCELNELQRCNSAGDEWVRQDTCLTVEQCAQAVTSQSTACPPLCTAGQLRCELNKLQVCNESGTGWDTEQTCENSPLCELAVSQKRSTCRAACVAGARRCNGAQLEECRGDLTGYDTIETCSSEVMCLEGEHGKCLPGGLNLVDDFEDRDPNMLVIPHDGRDGLNWWPTSDGTVTLTLAYNDDPGTGNSYLVATGPEPLNWGVNAGIFFPEATDLSRYAGIQFYARRAAGAASTVELRLPDAETDGTPDRGSCVTDCWNDFRYRFALSPQWQLYQVTWDQLVPVREQPGARAQFDPTQVTQFTYWVLGGDIELHLDDVAFLLPKREEACTAGEYRCTDLGWEPPGAGAVTSASVDSAACNADRCGPALERCAEDGSGWILVDTCYSTALCAEHRDEGLCTEPYSFQAQGCEPGEGRVRGREVWVCDPEGIGYELEETCDYWYQAHGPLNPRCRPASSLRDTLIDDLEDGDDALFRDAYPPGESRNRQGGWFSITGAIITRVDPNEPARPDSLLAIRAEAPTPTSEYHALGLRLAPWNQDARYDASMYAGIRFYAKTDASSWDSSLVLADIYSEPDYGYCTASEGIDQCYNHFGYPLSLTDAWQLFEIRWEDMARATPPEAGSVIPATLDPSVLQHLHWALPEAGDVIYVDDVEFLVE